MSRKKKDFFNQVQSFIDRTDESMLANSGLSRSLITSFEDVSRSFTVSAMVVSLLLLVFAFYLLALFKKLKQLNRQAVQQKETIELNNVHLQQQNNVLLSLKEDLRFSNEELIDRNSKLEESEQELHAANAELLVAEEELRSNMMDLLAQKQELERSEDRFKMLSALTFEGILVHEKGIVIDVNESLCRLSGFV